METPRRKFDRLVSALDQLVADEAATLRAGDFPRVQEIQTRAQPVVDALAELAPGVTDAASRAKIANLLARRQHTIDSLESQLSTARDELMSLHDSIRRVTQISPVYGKPSSAPSSQFRATG